MCQYASGGFFPDSAAHAKTRMSVAVAGTTLAGIGNDTDPRRNGSEPRIAAGFLFGSTGIQAEGKPKQNSEGRAIKNEL
jgi:hypothetical protein